jgi:hypothetical protein
MKKILYITIVILAVIACKKVKFSPEGPTDIRVRNLSNLPFTEVIVNTTEDKDTLGNIAPQAVSEYFRFKKAFPKAEISARINGVLFTTGPVNTTYMQYIGQDKITYEVSVSDLNNKLLTISNLIIEEPLVLK